MPLSIMTRTCQWLCRSSESAPSTPGGKSASPRCRKRHRQRWPRCIRSGSSSSSSSIRMSRRRRGTVQVGLSTVDCMHACTVDCMHACTCLASTPRSPRGVSSPSRHVAEVRCHWTRARPAVCGGWLSELWVGVFFFFFFWVGRSSISGFILTVWRTRPGVSGVSRSTASARSLRQRRTNTAIRCCGASRRPDPGTRCSCMLVCFDWATTTLGRYEKQGRTTGRTRNGLTRGRSLPLDHALNKRWSCFTKIPVHV